MLGYLLGAYLTSITVGLVLVFSLQGSSFSSTAKHTVSPAEDIAVGTILLVIAFVLATGRDAPIRERRRARKEAKARAGKAEEPWSQRMLGHGSTGLAFVVGALLSFPGLSYLAALGRIAKVNPGTTATVLLVVGFCLVQSPLEAPLLGFTFAPERTRSAIAPSVPGWTVEAAAPRRSLPPRSGRFSSSSVSSAPCDGPAAYWPGIATPEVAACSALITCSSPLPAS